MDERLETAAALFPEVYIVADIGANHGLLACYLLETRRAERMWLTDISAKALSRARQNIAARGLQSRTVFAVGDGFAALAEPVEAAAILGMGGQTITCIIKNAPDGNLPAHLVVSSHTDHDVLRRSLYEAGYRLAEERVAQSGGRFYIVASAVRDTEVQMPDERLLFLGPCLIRLNTPAYRTYLQRRLDAYRPSRTPDGKQRYEWLKEEAARAASNCQNRL